MKIPQRGCTISSMTHGEELVAYTRGDFRTWLQKHHAKESKVTVVLHKRHTGKPAPTHRELLEEAICFGWIDTTIKRIDADRFARRFSRRNEKSSKWSDNTLGYAKRLIKEGKMTAEGLRFYKLGAARPTHDHGIPKNPDMPEDLKHALAKSGKSKAAFEKTAPSMKRTLYRWILRAKRAPTRAKRVKLVVAAARGGKSVF